MSELTVQERVTGATVAYLERSGLTGVTDLENTELPGFLATDGEDAVYVRLVTVNGVREDDDPIDYDLDQIAQADRVDVVFFHIIAEDRALIRHQRGVSGE
jgi:hypothetical protein